VTGQKIILDAFDEYFEGRPGIEKYVARVIPDTATMFLELKFGGIDFMSLTPPQFKLQANSELFKKYFQKFRYPTLYLSLCPRCPSCASQEVQRCRGSTTWHMV